ncbi:MAG: hypothetical protein WCK96_00240 [Methylococcales bacterium]
MTTIHTILEEFRQLATSTTDRTKNAADALHNQLILRAQNLENSKIDWSKFSNLLPSLR